MGCVKIKGKIKLNLGTIISNLNEYSHLENNINKLATERKKVHIFLHRKPT